MDRITVFAHYDKNNLIQDYVIYYLRELKKISQKIIFVSDGDISEKELSKLSGIVDYCIAKKHGEYDFGSYKRGYLYAKEQGWLNVCEELILCNDSCYGPLFDIEKYFEEMSSKPVDFWGNTANPYVAKREGENLVSVDSPHVQSYFVVLKSQVFKSEIFNKFMLSIKKENHKDFIIINYEIGLTKMLQACGYTWDVYCNSSKITPHSQVFHYKELIEKDKNPFVKTSIYRWNNIENGIYPSLKIIKNNSNYDIGLIKKDLAKNLSINVKNIARVIKHNITPLFCNVFSVKNVYNNLKKYKHISLLGFKINIRVRNTKEIRKFINANKPQKLNDSNADISRNKVYLSIVSIYKNEPDLKEFIEYHKLAGVERFYLYDNESTDGSREMLQTYIDDGTVVYNYVVGDMLQYPAYRDAIYKFKNETEWMAIIDLDEFIVPVNKNDIKDVLREFEQYPALGVNWVMFDSNGIEKRPNDKLCIEAYTRVTKDYQNRENRHIKSIVKPKMVQLVTGGHYCLYKGGRLAVNEQFEYIGRKDAYCDIENAFTKKNSVEKIQINHYHSKSKEDYMKKMIRGFADHPRNIQRPFNDAYLNFKVETSHDYKIQKFVQELRDIMDINSNV